MTDIHYVLDLVIFSHKEKKKKREKRERDVRGWMCSLTRWAQCHPSGHHNMDMKSLIMLFVNYSFLHKVED